MKSPPASAGLDTCLLTGLTRQRASPIFLQRVSRIERNNVLPPSCWHYRRVMICWRLSYIPGYAFLLFQDESSVQALIDACIQEDGKLYLCVSSPTIKDKPVSLLFCSRKMCMYTNKQKKSWQHFYNICIFCRTI